MLFSFGEDIVESEKERNLYYKFFAGYYFNELVSGWEDRLHRFTAYVQESYVHKAPSLSRPIVLRPESTHVSFDCHAYLLDRTSDRGEFADIMLYDMESKCLVAIEAKFLSDWNFEKDIKGNGTRLNALRKNLPDDTQVIQCLLVTRTKWESVQAMVNHPASNFKNYNRDDNRVVLLFWENLFRECTDDRVRSFFDQHILRRRSEFRLTLGSTSPLHTPDETTSASGMQT